MTGAAAVILAAGQGLRIGGRAKAALRLPDGRTFVDTIIATARAAGCGTIVVVTAAPHEAETRAAISTPVQIVVNPAPERGMASSFAAALDALPSDLPGALLWPVDVPSPRAATIAALLAAGTPETIVVPAHGDRGGHPTWFGRATFPLCRDAVAQDGGLRAVIAGNRELVIRVTVDDPGVAHDVDTPADYDKISRI